MLDVAFEVRAIDPARFEVCEILPVMRVGEVQEAIRSETEIVGTMRGRPWQIDGHVGHLAVRGDALDAARDGIIR